MRYGGNNCKGYTWSERNNTFMTVLFSVCNRGDREEQLRRAAYD